ncbi:hypothetical protein AAFF_G00025510 [Aldrovandia affinis]|uniref:Uncharacterized protein n=1 Tax=Aldrovandia affinis TaxID=143900 RepID=A0AAD7S4V0_9TELE|nr:hypothetical protein AAFF_G00025510 [Aldrovandia affinis]
MCRQQATNDLKRKRFKAISTSGAWAFTLHSSHACTIPEDVLKVSGGKVMDGRGPNVTIIHVERDFHGESWVIYPLLFPTCTEGPGGPGCQVLVAGPRHHMGSAELGKGERALLA